MENNNYELVVEIDNILQNNVKDFVFYFKIDNTSIQDKEIKFGDIIYVTNKREEINPDRFYLFSGNFFHRQNADSLKISSNAFKKIGFTFESDYLKKSVNNDKIIFPIELIEEGVKIIYYFEKTDNVWCLIDTKIEFNEYDVNKKLTSIQRKQIEKKLLTRIERLESFEERLGVSIQNLSISYNYDYGNSFILFELHSNTDFTIKEIINVFCVFYDENGAIIFTSTNSVYPRDFYGFTILTFRIHNEFLYQIHKIKIYPQRK